LVCQLQERLAAWNKRHPKGIDGLSELEISEKTDLDAQIECLNKAYKSYDEAGPLFDCVVFHDGVNWRVAIDVTETGDFSSATLLCDYKLERKYASFGTDEMLNYSVKIYDNGETLRYIYLSICSKSFKTY
jgi:tripeptidyl-peptidase-2